VTDDVVNSEFSDELVVDHLILLTEKPRVVAVGSMLNVVADNLSLDLKVWKLEKVFSCPVVEENCSIAVDCGSLEDVLTDKKVVDIENSELLEVVESYELVILELNDEVVKGTELVISKLLGVIIEELSLLMTFDSIEVSEAVVLEL
jgi:hypothetical protein